MEYALPLFTKRKQVRRADTQNSRQTSGPFQVLAYIPFMVMVMCAHKEYT